MNFGNIKNNRAHAVIQAAGGLANAISLARVAQVASTLSSSEVGETTLSERLEACECFMVRDDDVGMLWEMLAETIRAGITAHQWDVADELLRILEGEIQREIFHDYLNGDYREEIKRRVAVLRLSKEH